MILYTGCLDNLDIDATEIKIHIKRWKRYARQYSHASLLWYSYDVVFSIRIEFGNYNILMRFKGNQKYNILLNRQSKGLKGV